MFALILTALVAVAQAHGCPTFPRREVPRNISPDPVPTQPIGATPTCAPRTPSS